MINEGVLEVLSEFNISQNNGVPVLLCLYYGYKPEYVPLELVQKLNLTGIYRNDRGTIHWNIPLFEGQQTAFDWVGKEYCSLFKQANPTRGGHEKDAMSRLKALFAKHPEVRKEDIIGATKMYLSSTDPRYIMMPHYFILKGTGGAKTQTITEWLDKWFEKRTEEQAVDGRNSVTNTMQ